MTVHRMPDQNRCSKCGHNLTASEAVPGQPPGRPLGPSPGDNTLCIACGHTMAYNDDLTLRELTEEEMAESNNNPFVRAAKRLIVHLRAKLN
jgi:hypothetical protein